MKTSNKWTTLLQRAQASANQRITVKGAHPVRLVQLDGCDVFCTDIETGATACSRSKVETLERLLDAEDRDRKALWTALTVTALILLVLLGLGFVVVRLIFLAVEHLFF